MQRIHYGNLTIDVASEVADAVLKLHQCAALRQFSRYAPGAADPEETEVFAVGSTELARFSGYLNGAEQPGPIQLIVGTAIPLAFSASPSGLPDPASTASDRAVLVKQIQEYEGGEE